MKLNWITLVKESLSLLYFVFIDFAKALDALSYQIIEKSFKYKIIPFWIPGDVMFHVENKISQPL